ncbi:universal stress protein [Saccharibacillus qingshengii]|uniref:universal stress protein n=1 Tax=Saccharibacillus qingshengii TaxID=1763540 RepID=UPI001555EDB4|nr:universal stress protein [Saccharibacillus qingshengii]
MKHILVAIDGSPGADRALEEAIRLASALKDAPAITVLHVDQALSMNEPAIGFDPEARIEAEGLVQLRPAEALLADSGLNYQTAVRRGDPAREICEFARREGCDLIAVGTRGHGPAAELLLGSVSHKVVQHAPCPVLTIR